MNIYRFINNNNCVMKENHNGNNDIKNSNILIVDDIKDNVSFLYKSLSKIGYNVKIVPDGLEAIDIVHDEKPNLIILDINMPDINGYEVCKRIKSEISTKDIPIIFLSCMDHVTDKVKAFDVGGVDFINKPFQIQEVIARIKTHLTISSLQQELANKNKELEKLVITDHLTGIFNRRYFFNLASVELERAKRYNHRFSLIILDIDHFKNINDTYGHLAGDQVLKSIAKICSNSLRASDTLARFGGEEFVILLMEADGTKACVIAERLREEIEQTPIEFQNYIMKVTASFGVISLFDNDEETIDSLVNQADMALYQSKHNGRNRVTIFTEHKNFLK